MCLEFCEKLWSDSSYFTCATLPPGPRISWSCSNTSWSKWWVWVCTSWTQSHVTCQVQVEESQCKSMKRGNKGCKALQRGGRRLTQIWFNTVIASYKLFYTILDRGFWSQYEKAIWNFSNTLQAHTHIFWHGFWIRSCHTCFQFEAAKWREMNMCEFSRRWSHGTYLESWFLKRSCKSAKLIKYIDHESKTMTRQQSSPHRGCPKIWLDCLKWVWGRAWYTHMQPPAWTSNGPKSISKPIGLLASRLALLSGGMGRISTWVWGIGWRVGWGLMAWLEARDCTKLAGDNSP